jgi:hypothetical protein
VFFILPRDQLYASLRCLTFITGGTRQRFVGRGPAFRELKLQ